MPKFEVQFVDGKTIVKDKDTADQAKAEAKAERRVGLPRDVPASAAEVKVARVTRLEEKSRARE